GKPAKGKPARREDVDPCGGLTRGLQAPSVGPSGEPTGPGIRLRVVAGQDDRTKAESLARERRRPVEPDPGNAGEGSHQASSPPCRTLKVEMVITCSRMPPGLRVRFHAAFSPPCL